MRKPAWYVGVALLVLVFLSFQSCDLGGALIQPDGEWKGPYSLSTSDPLDGDYHYHSYSFDALAGTEYELGLRSLDYNGVGLSFWPAGYEDVVLSTYTDLEVYASRVAIQNGRVEFSVWINRNRLVSGPARYEFYIVPVN